MKQHNIMQCVLAASMLVSVSVNAEDKYPASDFKPTVVYQDESVAKAGASSDSSKPASSKSSASSNDSNYPAANFEPKVVYTDDKYKHADVEHKNSTASSSNSFSTGDTSSSVSAAATTETAKSEDSSFGYLLGLIALAGAGFFLYKKGAFGAEKSSVPASAVRHNINAGGLTGVARYVLKASGTGVSRYIEKNVRVTQANAASSATGVAKYLANQATAPKANATGVEKYLKNKG